MTTFKMTTSKILEVIPQVYGKHEIQTEVFEKMLEIVLFTITVITVVRKNQ